TWVHTAAEELATCHPLAEVLGWLGGLPFLRVARDAIVNLNAVKEIVHYGDRLYQLRLSDRGGTVVEASRSAASRLARHRRRARGRRTLPRFGSSDKRSGHPDEAPTVETATPAVRTAVEIA